jgi:hypothetical protein
VTIFNQKLKQANQLLLEIRKEIDVGVVLSKEDAKTLNEMQAMARDMRDFAIFHDQSPGKVVAKRWGLTESRVSQIKTQFRTGVTTYVSRVAKKAANISKDHHHGR